MNEVILSKMQTKKNSKWDLIWILPEIIGELFLIVYIPIIFIRELNAVGILSITGMLYIAIVFLLLTNIRLSGLYELVNVKWRKQQKRSQ